MLGVGACIVWFHMSYVVVCVWGRLWYVYMVEEKTLGAHQLWQSISVCTKRTKEEAKNQLKDRYQYFILVLSMHMILIYDGSM